MNTLNNRGFTFVETLVAITVMLLVIIGPMTVAQKGIQTAYFATEQATAVFLAQEAVESVRELRDSQALSVYNKSDTDTSNWISSCDESGCPHSGKLWINRETGRYQHYESGEPLGPSPFTRLVEVSEAAGTAEIKVTVSWDAQVFGGNEKSVELKTWVYDHYQRYE